jgi:hypothetical protein
MSKSEFLVTIVNMMIAIPALTIVIALVAWSLHLMQQAVDRREFSLMLAGTLVAFSAAALMAVYFLVGDYIGYVTHMTHAHAVEAAIDPLTWVLEVEAEAVVQPAWQAAFLDAP